MSKKISINVVFDLDAPTEISIDPENSILDEILQSSILKEKYGDINKFDIKTLVDTENPIDIKKSATQNEILNKSNKIIFELVEKKGDIFKIFKNPKNTLIENNGENNNENEMGEEQYENEESECGDEGEKNGNNDKGIVTDNIKNNINYSGSKDSDNTGKQTDLFSVKREEENSNVINNNNADATENQNNNNNNDNNSISHIVTISPSAEQNKELLTKKRRRPGRPRRKLKESQENENTDKVNEQTKNQEDNQPNVQSTQANNPMNIKEESENNKVDTDKKEEDQKPKKGRKRRKKDKIYKEITLNLETKNNNEQAMNIGQYIPPQVQNFNAIPVNISDLNMNLTHNYNTSIPIPIAIQGNTQLNPNNNVNITAKIPNINPHMPIASPLPPTNLASLNNINTIPQNLDMSSTIRSILAISERQLAEISALKMSIFQVMKSEGQIGKIREDMAKLSEKMKLLEEVKKNLPDRNEIIAGFFSITGDISVDKIAERSMKIEEDLIRFVDDADKKVLETVEKMNPEDEFFKREFSASIIKELSGLVREDGLFRTLVTTDISYAFESEMSDDVFYALLRQSIKKVRGIWPREMRNACYNDISKLLISRYRKKLDCEDDGVLKNLLKDLILEILHAPAYDNYFNSVLGSSTRHGIESLEPIEIEDKSRKISISFDITKLKEFCVSKCISSAFVDVLNLLSKRKKELKNKEIRKRVGEYFEKHKNIYFCELPGNAGSLTIFDGTIFIKKEYYLRVRNAVKTEDKVQGLAQILMLVFTEVMKILYRIYRREKSTADNNEVATSFNELIFGDLYYIFMSDCEYILDLSNYGCGFKEFKDKFLKARTKAKNKEKKYMRWLK